jgi:hypothetical protein
VLRYGGPSAGGETVLFDLKLGQPVGQGAMPTALPMTRTISAMATAASANSRRVSYDELRRWAVELIVSGYRRMVSTAISGVIMRSRSPVSTQPCGPRCGRCRSSGKAHRWCSKAVRIGSVTAPHPPCLLGEPKPGRRQAVRAEAAKRGRDSASLYVLRPVRFTAVSSKRAQTSSLRI